VRARTAATDAQQSAVQRLRRDVARQRRQALQASREGAALEAETTALEIATGADPVSGPGLRVTLGNARSGGDVLGTPRAGASAGSGSGRVVDRDLQDVVNALWASGPEAVAVGDQRLTAQSAIRSAGEAILVDFRPVSEPYVVSAIGDPARLESDFAATATARRFRSYSSAYGLVFTIRRSGSVRPAAVGRRPHAAAGPAGRGRLVIPALALAIGVAIGLFVEPTVPTAVQPYLPIAVVAALDALFGGLRARLDGIFDDKVFVVSFVSNVLVAGVIVFLGDQLGVGGQLSTGVVVVLGIRIFANAAAIRRHLFRA